MKNMKNMKNKKYEKYLLTQIYKKLLI